MHGEVAGIRVDGLRTTPERLFDRSSLAVAENSDGAALYATDFQPGPSGFVRIAAQVYNSPSEFVVLAEALREELVTGEEPGLTSAEQLYGWCTFEILASAMAGLVAGYLPTDYQEEWDLDGLVSEVKLYFPTKFTAEELTKAVTTALPAMRFKPAEIGGRAGSLLWDDVPESWITPSHSSTRITCHAGSSSKR